MIFSGFPPTMVFVTTFLVTIKPVATIEFLPTVTPGRIVELDSIYVFFLLKSSHIFLGFFQKAIHQMHYHKIY